MKLLLLGANGQVGHELRRALRPLGDVVCGTRTGTLDDGAACVRADLSDPSALSELVLRIAPDVVVNAAAYTAVDHAESEPALAHAINAVAPGVLAEACALLGARLVHYSTDYVFDGSGERRYVEEDDVAPLGVYGRTKADGEQAVRDSGAEHLILRTAWVYGMYGHNFFRTMLRLGREQSELRVVADQVGTPTPAWWIADSTASLLLKPVVGTLHVVCAGTTTWHGFAEAIFDEARRAGIVAAVPSVRAIESREYPTPAQRPVHSVLSVDALSAVLGELPHWRLALARTIQRGVWVANSLH